MKLKDADALKDKLCEHCSAPFIRNCTIEECRDMLCSAMDAIDDTPAIDAVEVVRCKDCKYSLPNDGKLNDGARYCSRIYGGAKKEHPAVWDVDYCSGGKKKVQE